MEHREDPKPSFVGAELKKYLKKNGFLTVPKGKEKYTKAKENSEVGEQLKEEVLSFLDQIDAIKFL